MSDKPDFRETGNRIEQLLAEIRAMASPPTAQRVDELLRVVVELYGEGLRRIVDVVATPGLGGDDIAVRLLDDKLVESLLLLHHLHPEDFPTRVRKALERVRPYLGSHGGDIELVRADERSGAVRLRLGGSCDGCPSSILTVKLAVEGAIYELAPEATEIEVEGVVDVKPRQGLAANAGVEAARWVPLGIEAGSVDGKPVATEIPGARILLCRLGGNLYAYRDCCPSCGSAIDGGALVGAILSCPLCGERYDIHRAGRSLEKGDLHLDPLPLLADDRGIRIALGGTA